jgi:cytosine deaminase
MSQVANAQQAVELVANQALFASLQETFAVGGAIIENKTGNVVMEMHNNVLKPPNPGSGEGFSLYDPTAHGERQLVDWYFNNRSRLGLPPPSAMTIVTTLDPCAMCAGALLTGGFNVAVSAIDTYAGINYDRKFDFPTLPPALRGAAQRTWGYYAVDAPFSRPYVGGGTPVFSGGKVDAVTFDYTLVVFESSVGTIRTASSSGGLEPRNMSNPVNLGASSPVRQALSAMYPGALTVASKDPRFPGVELAQPLLVAAANAKAKGAVYNSVALLDPFGNLLICAGGVENISPIRTAFLELTRNYAELRYRLMNSSSSAIRAEALSNLTHARYCTFVHLTMPDPRTSQGVMTFGAYGSTMEGPIPRVFPSSFQYAQLPSGVGEFEVAQRAAVLPPFYTNDVGVSPQRVLDPALIAATK